MIEFYGPFQVSVMREAARNVVPAVDTVEPVAGGARPALDPASAARLRSIVDRNFEFLWRTLRRLGVPPDSVDDALQQVLLVIAHRLPEIECGGERAFLFGVTRRVASDARRLPMRRREVPCDADFTQMAHPMPGLDELVDQKRARVLLDGILDALPADLRMVFVLFEAEGLTSPEIAALLGLPLGTVASRLRRAREAFQVLVKRTEKEIASQGGPR